MLCQFSVKNYKSFEQEATLDFQATNITEHEDKIIVDPVDGDKYLPLAAIYGPNGSGKSNMLSAVYGLINKIMKPICAACDRKDCSSLMNSNYHITPFKFSKISIEQPTEFEIFFRANHSEYRYNLSVKDDIIVYENLSMRKLSDKKIVELFVRDQCLDEKIILNSMFFNNINVSGITDTLPLLSFLGITHKEMDVLNDVFNWIESGIEIINYSKSKKNFLIPKSKKTKTLLIQMLKEMDIDIEDYRVEKIKDNNVRIYTKHIVNNFEKELELNDESNGTVKLFTLLPFISRSITSGSTLIIDEIDANLHPKLLEYIIELYRNPIKNRKGAQLIFTSHDLMTMNSELFRRDEIWFVAKNGEQASQMYSLVEFKKENGKAPRKDEKYGKQYLEGRYGADPYLKRMINWEEQR